MKDCLCALKIQVHVAHAVSYDRMWLTVATTVPVRRRRALVLTRTWRQ